MHAQLLQSCLTLWDPVGYSPPGSSLSMGILQARVLEWAAMPSSRGSSQPRDRTSSLMSPALAGSYLLYIYFIFTSFIAGSLYLLITLHLPHLPLPPPAPHMAELLKILPLLSPLSKPMLVSTLCDQAFILTSHQNSSSSGLQVTRPFG